MKNVIKRLKSRLKQTLIHSTNISVPYTYLGTGYGGWPIVDGTLGPKDIILSFGLGTDISFDLAAIEKFDCAVIGFDPTPRSIDWLSKQTLPTKFSYHQIGIAAKDGEAEFYPPDNDEFVSFSSQTNKPTGARAPIRAPVKRLASILKDLQIPSPKVLKMDIEGFEYDVIDDIIASGIRPNQFLVEFHHTMYGISRDKTDNAVQQLERAGYNLFFVSDVGLEYGFVLKGEL